MTDEATDTRVHKIAILPLGAPERVKNALQWAAADEGWCDRAVRLGERIIPRNSCRDLMRRSVFGPARPDVIFLWTSVLVYMAATAELQSRLQHPGAADLKTAREPLDCCQIGRATGNSVGFAG